MDERRKSSERPKLRKWMVAAAAVGILTVSSLTVMAVNGFFTKTVTEEEGYVDYKFKVDYELTMNKIEITPGYIPDGYEKMEGAVLKYCADGTWQNGISINIIDARDLEQASMGIQNVKSVEKTAINGMEAHILTQEVDVQRQTRYFDKQILLFNPEDGYVCQVWGGNDIAMEELVKVAEELTFTETDDDIDLTAVKEEWKGKETSEEANERWAKEAMESWNYGVPEEYVLPLGQSSQVYGFSPEAEKDLLLNVTIKSAEICDSISGLPAENFLDYEKLQQGMNEDGTLKPYKRLAMERGEDGSYQEMAREEVSQKFLKIFVQAENPHDTMTELYAGSPKITWLEKNEDGSYAYSDLYTEPLNFQEYYGSSDGMPIYFDRSGFTEEQRKDFLFCELQPQETLEYTLIYLVDEDCLDHIYLNVQGAFDGNDTGYDPVRKEFTKNYVELKL